jgi:hypothetical protein
MAVKPKSRRRWCHRHFVNSRAMARAADIFQQVQVGPAKRLRPGSLSGFVAC